jgi:hypothetical protein
MATILFPLHAATAAALVACTLSLPLTAVAQQFSLEGAVVDSRNGNQLGVINERGELASLFRGQKALTFGILRSAGISLDQLSPEVRARIERFQTTNLEAFRAYAQGLDLKDQGRFTEAREQFRRAAELDPGFLLAAEQQQAMPDVNLTSAVQARAVIAQATSNAVDRGRAVYAVDLARAAAALQAGLEVVRIPADTAARRLASDDFTINPPGSGGARTPSQVVGLAYRLVDGAITVSSILPNEWRSGEVSISADGVLQSAGTGTTSVELRRGAASPAATGRADLPGGGVAYWGAWLSAAGASASLRSGTTTTTAPALGRVDWITADTPQALPGSGSYEFRPVGGSLADVTGTIRVDIPSRGVTLNDLGFRIDGLTFAGLRGSATYDDSRLASAPFVGNYSAGTCTGCSGFVPGSSVFAGQFVGRQAHGLVFSTVLLTGGGGTAAGVHLFTRPDTTRP